jgi:hypothetical protein
MTLVEAKLLEDGMRIESDSLTIDAHAARTGNLYGALKAVVLHPGLCVAYAGRVAAAQHALDAVGVRPDTPFSVEEVERTLLQHHLSALKETDFLVASLTPLPSLSVVRDGTVVRGLTSAYVGLPSAHAAFERAFAMADIPQGADVTDDSLLAARMDSAIRAVIEDPDESLVDGVPLSVTVEGGFLYATRGEMRAGASQSIPSHQWTTLRFGGAAEGGFAYVVCPAVEPGVGAVGVHFHQGNLGALFYPTVSGEPIKFSSVTLHEFEGQVRERYGIVIKAGMKIQ